VVTAVFPATAAAAAAESGFTGTLAIGDVGTVTLSSESLNMIYANDSSSISFPTGTDDSGEATLTTKFWIAETEVTNAVMAEVLQWAYDNGRFSTTVGDPNGLDTTTAKHGGQHLLALDDSNCRVDYDGSGTFSAESGYENNPVTNITWYGAVMFCNWLTEMRDGNTDNVVYTDIDTDWVDDETTENISRNGYRLPSSDEWEYTARYRGADSTNTVSGYSNPYYTKGNSASGAYTYYNDESDVNPANGVVDNKDANDEVAVYGYYYDGGWVSKGTSDEAEVKSLGAGSANALGLYDMSGNVWEWCFTESGTLRIYRSGSWGLSANDLQVGNWPGNWPGDYPFVEFHALGFRPCRTAD
jgi:formylglycine-generating enzyme required for sulfatase activity